MKNNTKAIVVIVSIIGLFATTLISQELYTQETERVLSVFENSSNEYGALIDKEVSVNFEVLYLLKSHFERQELVTLEEFNTIAGDVLDRYPDIQALEWIPIVSKSARISFETAMNKTYPDFEITERIAQGKMVRAGERENYYPVSLIKPVEGNEAAIGYDLGSNNLRFEALKKAEDSGKLVATSAITLVQEEGKAKGFLAFLPVYGEDKTLEGFVLGVYRFGSLFEQTGYKKYLKGINMTMVDMSSQSENNILYSYIYKNEKVKEERLHEREIANVGGRTWTIKSYPTSEYFILNHNGRHIPVFIIGVLISALLSYLYFVYMARKNSEASLLRSRRRVDALLDSTAEAIFGLDLDGNCTFVNASCLKILKYDSRSELIGKNMQSLIAHSEDSQGSSADQFYDTICKGGVIYYDESIFCRKDKTDIPVEYWAHPIFEGADIRGAVVTFFDITNKRILEREAIKAQKLESLGVIAGGIAHDFNNLLTTILGNISLVNMQVDKKSDISKLLGDCEKASVRASDLTTQLLTFSKVKMGNRSEFAVEDILHESRRIALGGSIVESTISINGDIPLMYGDEGQLSQVFNNILINAKQAMPDGGKVYISCSTVTINSNDPFKLKSGEYIKIKFQDEGIGIDDKSLANIFDPYFTTKETGSGLGLATSYSIVNGHKGYITAESAVSVGTTFTILLPGSGKMNSGSYEVRENPVSYYGTEKILVMDDDEDICEFVYQMLSKVGYNVITTRDGNEAIAEYRHAEETSSPYSIVILDLTIRGGRGGKETLSILKSMYPNVRAIVSSGYSEDPILANYGDYGFEASVSKPYKVDVMLKTVKEVIGES